MEIPEQYRAVCELCADAVDIRAMGVHQWTAGWVKQREEGGGHAIALPERAHRWAHGRCVEAASKGTLAQVALFEDA